MKERLVDRYCSQLVRATRRGRSTPRSTRKSKDKITISSARPRIGSCLSEEPRNRKKKGDLFVSCFQRQRVSRTESQELASADYRIFGNTRRQSW